MRERNREIESLEERATSTRIGHEKELVDIRIRYEAEMRREVQRRVDEGDRLGRELQECRRRLEQSEALQSQDHTQLQQQFTRIREQER